MFQLMELLLITVTCFHLFMGSDGYITVPPSNTAALNGASNVTMSCTSSSNYQSISWSFLRVGGSPSVLISTGSYVPDTQNYTVQQGGNNQNNLIIFSASPARAGIYYCIEGTLQASAQLIVINAGPVCTVTPNAPNELLWNQAVQMSCSISLTANTSYVNVNMTWSKDSSTDNIQSSTQMTTSLTLTTVSSNITQTPGNFTPFPIYRCKTTFGLTNLPTGSANNDPGYSKTTPLFNSPINVIYLNQANENTIQGAKSGDQVYLGRTVTCHADANPAASYSWLDVTYGNTTNSSSIQIWHDGDYRCTAWNPAASTSASINITTYITTTTTATGTSTATLNTASGTSFVEIKESANGGLSDGAKIGIGVGIGVGGIVIAGGIIFGILCTRHQRRKGAMEDKTGVAKTLGMHNMKTEDYERLQIPRDISNDPPYEPLSISPAQHENVSPTYEEL